MTPDQLADRLGLHRYARSWRGDCPSCGYADAFSMRSQRGGHLGIFAACGCERTELESKIRAIAGGDALPQRRQQDSDTSSAVREKKLEAVHRAWTGSQPAAGSIADTYLTSRGLAGLAASPALRFRSDCHHPEGGWEPAMVAQVVDVAGAMIAAHRTYLRRDGGGKTDREPARATIGPVWGGAVRLDPVAAELVIGEGIETSASAGRLLGLPAWAAVSAGNLGQGLILPQEVRAVVIAADADEPGERAARRAALRWQREGRSVRIARPDVADADFNDLLCRGHHA